MDDNFKNKIRTIWHVTSITMGEKIFDGKEIWGVTDLDRSANFHPSRTSLNNLKEKPEISIGFYWKGDIEFRNANNCKLDDFKENIMYVLVTDGFHELSVESTKIWACKIPPGSLKNLSCVDVVPFENMVGIGNFNKRFSNLKNKIDEPISMIVPTIENQKSIELQISLLPNNQKIKLSNWLIVVALFILLLCAVP